MARAAPIITRRLLSISRQGPDADSEDAAAVQSNAWPVRAAIADGATEAVFSRLWATLLAQGLVERAATPEALTAALPAWQARWRDAVHAEAQSAPWYVQEKVREGAFATLLGLELKRNGEWRAVTVGDGALFQLRDGTVQRAWPTTDPDAFTNRPALLPSRPGRPVPSPEAATGPWVPGDAFLLATDAVAAWLLRTDPVRARAWTADAFHDAVQAAHAEGTLRPDDATLLVLELDARTDP
ncbi:MAG: protein phosphatase 2C domain-containing protein [Salinibacter sp.]